MHPNTQCKNCKFWPVGLWDYPCRACDNEGRSPHPFGGEKIRNYFKRDPKKPAYVSEKVAEKKRREMGM